MRSIPLVACLGVLASPLAGEVEIRQSGDRVSLMAVSAPAAEILERLARQTGMRVVYDAQPPRQLITTRLEQRTTAEAVLGIMEGLGLNYVLVMDSAGTQVDQLLILGPVAAAPATATAVAAPRRHPEPPANPAQLEVDEEDSLTQEEDEEEEPAAQATPAADSPAPAVVPAAPPPDYPSSAFTPRLPPPPTPAPVNPAAVGGATPTPQPSPNPR